MGTEWIKYSYKKHEFKDVLQFPGVYVFYVGKKILYIGSSKNVRQRTSTYTRRFKAWGDGKNITLKVKYIKIYGYWLMLEHRLIRRLKPRHNTKNKY